MVDMITSEGNNICEAKRARIRVTQQVYPDENMPLP